MMKNNLFSPLQYLLNKGQAWWSWGKESPPLVAFSDPLPDQEIYLLPSDLEDILETKTKADESWQQCLDNVSFDIELGIPSSDIERQLTQITLGTHGLSPAVYLQDLAQFQTDLQKRLPQAIYDNYAGAIKLCLQRAWQVLRQRPTLLYENFRADVFYQFMRYSEHRQKQPRSLQTADTHAQQEKHVGAPEQAVLNTLRFYESLLEGNLFAKIRVQFEHMFETGKPDWPMVIKSLAQSLSILQETGLPQFSIGDETREETIDASFIEKELVNACSNKPADLFALLSLDKTKCTFEQFKQRWQVYRSLVEDEVFDKVEAAIRAYAQQCQTEKNNWPAFVEHMGAISMGSEEKKGANKKPEDKASSSITKKMGTDLTMVRPYATGITFGVFLLQAAAAASKTTQADGSMVVKRTVSPEQIPIANGTFYVDILSNYMTSASAFAVTIIEDIACVTMSNAQMDLINISNPQQPSLVVTVTTFGISRDIVSCIDDRHVCLVTEDNNFEFLIRQIPRNNPANITPIANYDIVGSSDATRLAVSGDHAYVIVGGDLVVIDFSNPGFPFEAGRFVFPSNAIDIAVEPPFVFTAHSIDGLRITDISNVPSFTAIGNYVEIDYRSVAVRNETIYIGRRVQSPEFRIFNATVPTSPLLLGSYDVIPPEGSVSLSVEAVTVSEDNTVYLAAEATGLVVLDATDLMSPTLIASLPFSIQSGLAQAQDVSVRGNIVCLAGQSGGLFVTTVDRVPILVNNQIMLPLDQSLILDTTHLSAIDNDDDPNSLVFFASEIRSLAFINQATGFLVTSFTQQALNASEIALQYIGDDDPLTLAFEVSVGDRFARTQPVSANIIPIIPPTTSSSSSLLTTDMTSNSMSIASESGAMTLSTNNIATVNNDPSDVNSNAVPLLLLLVSTLVPSGLCILACGLSGYFLGRRAIVELPTIEEKPILQKSTTNNIEDNDQSEEMNTFPQSKSEQQQIPDKQTEAQKMLAEANELYAKGKTFYYSKDSTQAITFFQSAKTSYTKIKDKTTSSEIKVFAKKRLKKIENDEGKYSASTIRNRTAAR